MVTELTLKRLGIAALRVSFKTVSPFDGVCAQFDAAKVLVLVATNGSSDADAFISEQFEVLNSRRANGALWSGRARFNERHQAWLNEQKIRFEKIGLWCDDLRVW